MSDKLNLFSEQDSDPWYKDGLKFKCTGCGKCCTGAPGAVWISDEESNEIARHLNISINEFIAKYTRIINGRRSLNENKKSFDCVFLNGKQCEIYTLRPKQCRTYPWWPKLIESKEAWNEESKWCEGINHKDATIVPFSDIIKDLASP